MTDHRSGRLSVAAAAWVVARRDFVAILFSRTFLFFLLGPLFPIIVAGLAGSVGARVQDKADSAEIGLVMQPADVEAITGARETVATRLGGPVPEFVVLHRLAPGEDEGQAVRRAQAGGRAAVVLSGTLAHPVLSGPRRQIAEWRGVVGLVAATAQDGTAAAWPAVQLQPTATDPGSDRRGRLRTAQSAQTLLFLLTMMLAGMVLSNLVEEKGNKIIEVLAAAIPMESVFFGKLLAMLGVSMVGIAAWGASGAALWLLAGQAAPHLAAPAVGWPMLVALGIVYFAMAYLLLGSVFLAIGSLASTVREVQTLSMPVTMMQLLVFFLATFAMTQPGSPIEIFAVLFPFSSPFAMLARAAQQPGLLVHLAAIAGQGLCVLLFVRVGSRLFRKRVMKSGAGRPRRERRRRGPFARRGDLGLPRTQAGRG